MPQALARSKRVRLSAVVGGEIISIDGTQLENPLCRSVDRFDRLGRNAQHPDTINWIFKSLVARAGRAKGLDDDEPRASDLGG